MKCKARLIVSLTILLVVTGVTMAQNSTKPTTTASAATTTTAKATTTIVVTPTTTPTNGTSNSTTPTVVVPTTTPTNGTSNSTTPTVVAPTTTPTNGTSNSTNTTVVAPTTTPTTIAPTTTLVPTTTVPPPPVDRFVVRGGNKSEVCLIMKAAMSMMIKDAQNKSITIDVPMANQTDYRGSCNDTLDKLYISWTGKVKAEDFAADLEFDFEKDGKNYYLSLIKADYQLTPLDVKNYTQGNGTSSKSHYKTLVGQRYQCTKTQSYKLSETITLNIKELKVQAFITGNNSDFSTKANDCASSKSKTSTLVPIIVGAALGGMVLIVLIGYCIGRRRTRSNYQELQ